MQSNVLGEIITFYSYKGGAGRSMALSNVACILAEKALEGNNVLMIDWDLEAPGLHRFFHDKFTERTQKLNECTEELSNYPGLIDLFEELESLIPNGNCDSIEEAEKSAYDLIENVDLEKYVIKTDIPNLSLLKAGCFDDRYSNRINTFNWENLYKRSPYLFSSLAEKLRRCYKHILIDSRTGYTDISGICTTLMPQKLVIVFTPNRQNYGGVLEIVRRAIKYRRNSEDLRPLLVYPLPSRIESSRDDLRTEWRFGEKKKDIEGYQPMFEELFKEIYGLPECNLNAYFEEVQIQQSPDFAYGEEIAVIVEGTADRFSLSESYKIFADWLIRSAIPWQRSVPDLFSKIPISAEEKLRNKNFLFNIGILLSENGSVEEAIEFYNQALKISKYDGDRQNEGISLAGLGNAYRQKGDYEKSLIYYSRALEIIEKVVGQKDNDFINISTSLASLYREMGEYEKALLLNQKILEINEMVNGSQHPSNAAILNNLALLYVNIGDYEKALRLYLNALEIIERVMGSQHPDVATAINNLAGLYEIIGDYEKALLFHKRALDIREKVRGSNHLDIANSLNNLALLYGKMGEYEKALPLFQRAIEIFEKLLSPYHPDIAKILSNLAGLYTNIGEYEKALPLYQKALEINETALSPHHPDVATSLNNLALLYYHMGEYEKALPICQKALEINGTVLNEYHPSIAATLNNLALIYEKMGEYGRAILFCQRAYEIFEKVLSPHHPDVAITLSNLAELYRKMGDYEIALSLQLNALEKIEKVLGPQHPSVKTTLNNLARLYEDLGDHEKAISIYQRIGKNSNYQK